MANSDLRKLILTAVIILLGVAVLWPTFYKDSVPEGYPFKPIRLGLDLQGGSYLILGVQTREAVKSHVAAIATSLRGELREQKIGLLRTKQVSDRGLQVTLSNSERIAELEAWMKENYPSLAKIQEQRSESRVDVTFELSATEAKEIERNAVIQAIETIRNRVDQYGVAEPVIQRSGVDRIMVQLPDVTNLETVKKTIGSIAKLDFRLVASLDTPEDQTITLKTRDGGQLRLEDQILMTGDAIQSAIVDISPQTNEIQVSLKLNSFGTKTFARITEENVNRQLAIILDGRVQSSPVIRESITGGTAQISGGFSKEEAHQLTVVLRSGALPAPLTFEQERTVGASLGADSIKKGIQAMMAGAGIVILFMMVYYKRSGVLAVFCLGVNILLLVASLALLGATLTLPGLAGLALTVGMAVDANVIIFERIREEIRNKATVASAVVAGFDKAHWTILDANLTTLLAAVILYVLGTGPIRGFAVTLALGIVTTLFAALFLCKLGFKVLSLKNSRGELSI